MVKMFALLAGVSLCWADGFDVASVRPNLRSDRIVTVQLSPGGEFTVRGYTLALLIQRAYAVRLGYVSGGPAWVYTDRFDIAAKASVTGKFTETQMRPMLVKLLGERFRLQAHSDTRKAPGYALEIARGGAKLTRSAAIEENPDSSRMTNEKFTSQAIGMADFARFLGNKLGVVVMDETGIAGIYDVRLRWELPLGQVAIAPPGDEAAETRRAAAFEAVERELGLTVRSKVVGVPTVVIDHAEKPGEADN